jgi:hypothetical protein
MRVSSLAAAVSLGLISLFAATSASAQRAGSSELRCTVAGGFGLIVGSNRKVTCVYYRRDGAVEFYVGSTSRIGVDIGPNNAARAAYEVVGADPVTPGVLQGDFAGPGLGATVGAGIGADALVGHGVTLMPIVNVYDTGINVSAGLGILHLDYAGMEPRR